MKIEPLPGEPMSLRAVLLALRDHRVVVKSVESMLVQPIVPDDEIEATLAQLPDA